MAVENLIWITDEGDDKRDGSSEADAVRSWGRALELSLQTGKGFYIPNARTFERLGREALKHASLAERPQPQTYA